MGFVTNVMKKVGMGHPGMAYPTQNSRPLAKIPPGQAPATKTGLITPKMSTATQMVNLPKPKQLNPLQQFVQARQQQAAPPSPVPYGPAQPGLEKYGAYHTAYDYATGKPVAPWAKAIESQAPSAPARQAGNEVSNAFVNEGIKDPNILAYALATIQHETANSFKPGREGAYNDTKYGYPEGFTGQKQAEKRGYSGGNNYYGRGYVQLTHDYNYDQVGNRIGLGDKLVKNPDLELDPEIAARTLAAFFKDRGVAAKAKVGDFVGARKGVNGTDKARLIANSAQRYRRAMR